ncbi:divergent polysaccharide deacetylase family protein [Lentibacter sp.]|uniref:divergent polysaccharide deacetylase family protein n=1 Tax=Lentibacter sp. TaxID=2024994 RepID=UPI003F69B582
MARGFLSGVIVGTLVAGVGVGALSLATDLPPESAPVKAAQEADAIPQAKTSPVAVPDVTVEESAPVMGQAPSATAPEPESLTATDTQTAAKPDAELATAALDAPDQGVAPEQRAETDQPVAAQSVLEAPMAPEAESDLAVSTETAEPQAPSVAEPVPEAEPQPAPVPDEDREEITLTIPSLPEEDEGGRAPEPTNGAESPVETARVSIGTPARTLGDGSSSRLPSMGSGQSDAAAGADAEVSGTVDINDLPPIERFAAPFVPTEGVPQMAIVLIDDGTSEIGVEALSTFPYPLSFAVDTSWSGAEAAMKTYRSAGFEVLAMVNLPRGARASDVEVSMPVLLDKLPEAVAIMETPDAALQDSREVIAQVSAYLADSGHGMLLFPKGLNTAQKVAAKEGVPSATVFRDFDSKGQNASTIKRFLSHAALKAEAEGGVVMVGRLRADTISALLLWGLQERGDRLELAPVSGLLKTP